MTSEKFHHLFGGPPRQAGKEELSQRHMDIAASIQAVTEEAMLRCGRHLHAITGMKSLCLAGGVALNCVANGKLLREGPFDSIWIQPAAGDAGGALGAALFVHHQLLDGARPARTRDVQKGSLLGPRFSNDAVEDFLRSKSARYNRHDDADLAQRVAELIDDGKVIGWFQGAMEFGPRALGSRSILGDARSPDMQTTMNLKIKFRESFRPFAPVVLREKATDWFALPKDAESPYMLIVAPVADRVRINNAEPGLQGLEKLKARRSQIPAVTHVDASARVQTVDPERAPRLHELLRAFEERTGCPVLINTSFNVRGEPIVCTPDDAWRCFLGTNIDVLIMENFVILRDEQPNAPRHAEGTYATSFEPD